MSTRTLSKGTLGLKFMNRAPPPGAGSASRGGGGQSAQHKSASTVRSTDDANYGHDHARKSKVAVPRDNKPRADELLKATTEQSAGSTDSTSKRSRVVHESSLLSFPLLSASYSGSSSSSSKTNRTAHTSALTSTTASTSTAPEPFISGRMSFGGANLEIEQMHNPQPIAPVKAENAREGGKPKRDKAKGKDKDKSKGKGHTASPLTTTGRASAAAQDKKSKSLSKLKSDRLERIVFEDQGAAIDTDADEVKFEGGGSGESRKGDKKKTTRRAIEREGDDQDARAADVKMEFDERTGFAKPKGFEGSKKKKQKSSNTRLGQVQGQRKGKAKDVAKSEPVWGQRGEEREWDHGKDDSDSDSDSDSEDEEDSDAEEDSDSESEDGEDDSEDDDDDDIAELARKQAPNPKGNKARMKRQVDEMIKAEEEGHSRQQKSKKVKKQSGR